MEGNGAHITAKASLSLYSFMVQEYKMKEQEKENKLYKAKQVIVRDETFFYFSINCNFNRSNNRS